MTIESPTRADNEIYTPPEALSWAGKYANGLWIRYIKFRIDTDRDFRFLVVGESGSGKSTFCIAGAMICEYLLLGTPFPLDRIIFDPLELIQHANKDYPPGTNFVLEEVGIQFDSSNWQDLEVKLIVQFFEICRSKGWIFWLNTVSSSMLAKKIRQQVHSILSPIAIDRRLEVCKCKAELIQHNDKLDKTYYKRLRVITENGVRPVRCFTLPKPPESFLREYKKKKDAFQRKIFKSIEKQIREARSIELRGGGKPAHCNKCKYDYLSRSNGSVPSKCPRCQAKDTSWSIQAPESPDSS